MANYINKYANQAAYDADDTKQFPNVSYLIEEDLIKWKAEQDYVLKIVFADKTKVYTTNETVDEILTRTGKTYADIIEFYSVEGVHNIKKRSINLKKLYIKNTIPNSSVSNNFLNGIIEHITVDGNPKYLFNENNSYNILRTYYGGEYHYNKNCDIDLINCSNYTWDGTYLVDVDKKTLIYKKGGSFDLSGLPENVETIKANMLGDDEATTITFPSHLKGVSNCIYSYKNLKEIRFEDDSLLNVLNFGDIDGVVNKGNVEKYYVGSQYLTKVGFWGLLKQQYSRNAEITLIFKATTPPTLNYFVSYQTTEIKNIYVPDEAIEDYKAATNWSEYASIIKPLSEYVEE